MAKAEAIGIAQISTKLSELLNGRGDDGAAQRGAMFAFAIRVASAGIAFLSQILLARWMGVFEYGVFTYVWILVYILSAFSCLGLNTSVLRFMPEYRETGAHGLAQGFARGSFAFIFLFSTGLAVFGTGAVFLFSGTLPDIYFIPIILALICLPMFALSEVADGMARAHSWINVGLVPIYIIRPALLLMFLAAAVLWGAEPNARIAMLAVIGATWITAIGQYLFLRRRLTDVLTPAPSEYRMRFWLKISFPVFLLEGFYLLLTYSDILIMNIFMTPRDVAIYFAVIKTTSLIEFVYFSVTAAGSHKFSEYHAAGRTDDLRRFLKTTIKWTFWPSLAAACVILALGMPILWLFGPEFVSGYPIMFILVIGLLARAATGPAEALMNMLGQQNLCAVVLCLATIANISLNLLLIPSYGLVGAAVATTCSLIMISVLLFFAIKRRLNLHAFVFGGREEPRKAPGKEPAKA